METEDRVDRVGELAASLTPAIEVATNVLEPPPSGAARLLGRDGDVFRWEPVSGAEWARLSPFERGRIIIERGRAWLDLNGDVKASPLAFMDATAAAASAERLFGMRVRTLREAICLVHHLLHENPVRAKSLSLVVGGSLLFATGLHGIEATPELLDILIAIYAEFYCPPSVPTITAD